MSEIEAIFEDLKGTFIGIDLGTTNTVVSYFRNGAFDQVPFRNKKTIPSAIFFEQNGDVIFGDKALKKGAQYPSQLLREFKRDLGSTKKYSIIFPKVIKEVSSEIQYRYVIDTNVFIDEPLILDTFHHDDYVTLPIKVIDELSYRKTQSDTQLPAEMAIDNIEKHQKSATFNLEFKKSSLESLSDDLEKDSKNSINDNRILSIAKVLSENCDKVTYLVTNDKGLMVKASTENVMAIDYDDFKEHRKSIKPDSSQINNERKVTPKEASRMLLQYIRNEASKYLQLEVDKAVITVPANFNNAQITQTKEAGLEAGFEDIRILKEPVAVGFAYSFEENGDSTVLVYDFGGGTFDASLLKVSSGKIDVIDINGDPKLGGKDITDKLIQLILDKLFDEDLDMMDESKSGLSKADYANNYHQILLESERAKIELSDCQETSVDIANLIKSDDSTFNFQCKITRKEFESEIVDIRKQTIDIIAALLNNNGIDKSDLVLVVAGGSSHIPSIRDSLIGTLGVQPKMSIDTSLVIAQGATIEAIRQWDESNSLQEKIIFNDDSLHDFGIGIKDHRFDLLIPSGTALPFRETREYTTEKDDQEEIKVRAFQRKSSYPEAKKTFDFGVSFVDEIMIEGIPTPNNIGDYTIKVTFELTKDDSLDISVELLDKHGQRQNQKALNIKRASNV
jgi:molecular chaperone DnaK (HSP70)